MIMRAMRHLNDKALTARTALIIPTIFLSISTTQAAVFTVTNGDDAGPGSLRSAIIQANAQAGADEINFDASVTTITINSSSLDITDTLTINGIGKDAFTIVNEITNDPELFFINATNLNLNNLTLQQTASAFGVPISNLDGTVICDSINFEGHPNATAPVQFAEFTGGALTLRDAHLNGNGVPANTNAAIDLLDAQLTTERTTIEGFYATSGAVIRTEDGQITLQDTTISNNTAAQFGGAILSLNDTITIRRSVFENNSAFEGAALSSIQSQILIDDSLFKDNETETQGGAIWDSESSLIIRGTTFSGNTAKNGGALFLNKSVLQTINTTLSGNRAAESGGAIYLNQDGSSNISSTTLADNVANIEGGALYAPNALENTIVNSVLSRNSAPTSPNIAGEAQLSFSFVSNDAGANIRALSDSNQVGSDGATLNSTLGSLSDNGGLKVGSQSNTTLLTHAILEGSSLIDAGDASALYSAEMLPGTDQRGSGFPRVRDSGLDIGAVEYVASIDSGTPTGGGTTGGDDSTSSGATGLTFFGLMMGLLMLRARRQTDKY